MRIVIDAEIMAGVSSGRRKMRAGVGGVGLGVRAVGVDDNDVERHAELRVVHGNLALLELCGVWG